MEPILNCSIATLKEVKKRWQGIIYDNLDDNRYNLAADEFIEEIKKGTRVTYIAKFNDLIVCDLTVIVKEEGILHESQNTKELVSQDKAFICGVRTDKEFENRGYFSKLYKYMENDLKNKGYKKLTISVENNNTRAKEIYKHLGFTNFMRTENNNGHIFEYYYKDI